MIIFCYDFLSSLFIQLFTLLYFGLLLSWQQENLKPVKFKALKLSVLHEKTMEPVQIGQIRSPSGQEKKYEGKISLQSLDVSLLTSDLCKIFGYTVFPFKTSDTKTFLKHQLYIGLRIKKNPQDFSVILVHYLNHIDFIFFFQVVIIFSQSSY